MESRSAAKRQELVELRVTAKVPMDELRRMFDGLKAEGYEKSWREYLNEECEAFEKYASGWWTIDSITWTFGRRRVRAAA